jgi:hypothetical protein
MCSLIWSAGGGLSPRQRKQVSEVLPKASRTAVISASTVARAMVTALHWFGVSIRAFNPTQEAAALAYLELSADEAPPVLAVSKRLRARVQAEVAQAG